MPDTSSGRDGILTHTFLLIQNLLMTNEQDMAQINIALEGSALVMYHICQKQVEGANGKNALNLPACGLFQLADRLCMPHM